MQPHLDRADRSTQDLRALHMCQAAVPREHNQLPLVVRQEGERPPQPGMVTASFELEGRTRAPVRSVQVLVGECRDP